MESEAAVAAAEATRAAELARQQKALEAAEKAKFEETRGQGKTSSRGRGILKNTTTGTASRGAAVSRTSSARGRGTLTRGTTRGTSAVGRGTVRGRGTTK
jgi:hypothetical protein